MAHLGRSRFIIAPLQNCQARERLTFRRDSLRRQQRETPILGHIPPKRVQRIHQQRHEPDYCRSSFCRRPTLQSEHDRESDRRTRRGVFERVEWLIICDALAKSYQKGEGQYDRHGPYRASIERSSCRPSCKHHVGRNIDVRKYACIRSECVCEKNVAEFAIFRPRQTSDADAAESVEQSRTAGSGPNLARIEPSLGNQEGESHYEQERKIW